MVKKEEGQGMAFCCSCKKEIDALTIKCPHCNYTFPEKKYIEDKLRHKFVRNLIVSGVIVSAFCYNIFSARYYFRHVGEIILGFLLFPLYILSSILFLGTSHGPTRIANSVRGGVGLTLFIVSNFIMAFLYGQFLAMFQPKSSELSVAGRYYPSKFFIYLFMVWFVLVFSTSFVTFPTKYIDCDMYRFGCKNNLKQIGISLMIYANAYEEHFPPYDGAKGLDILSKNGFLKNQYIFLCPTVTLNNYGEKRISNNEFILTDYEYYGGLKESDPKDTPIAWDKASNHTDCRNVLFLDGKVKEIKNKEWEETVYPRLKEIKAAKKGKR